VHLSGQVDCRDGDLMNPHASHRWSQDVTQHSHALALDDGVFSLTDPKDVARSLKRSAERSHDRKSDPYRSAMSMLSFYINRAGDQLPAAQRKRLEAAKDELRSLYHRSAVKASSRRTR
jgi:hypothetical protein